MNKPNMINATITITLIARTARQEFIINKIAQSEYYKDKFIYVIPTLSFMLQDHDDTAVYNISENTYIDGNSIKHEVEYEISSFNRLPTKDVEAFIRTEFEKSLIRNKFYSKS